MKNRRRKDYNWHRTYQNDANTVTLTIDGFGRNARSSSCKLRTISKIDPLSENGNGALPAGTNDRRTLQGRRTREDLDSRPGGRRRNGGIFTVGAQTAVRRTRRAKAGGPRGPRRLRDERARVGATAHLSGPACAPTLISPMKRTSQLRFDDHVPLQ